MCPLSTTVTLFSRQCREAFAKEFDDIEAEVKVREL